MKTKIIKSSFRLFSFLAEKTGGWRIFVQPKLWLGVMLLGTATSCIELPPEPMCYDPALEVTCYLVGPPQ